MRNKDDIIESMRAIIKQLLETNTKCDNTQQQLHRGGRVVEPPYLAVGRVGIPQRQQQQPQPISTQKPQEGLARAKPMMEPFDLAPPKVSLVYLWSIHAALPLSLTPMITHSEDRIPLIKIPTRCSIWPCNRPRCCVFNCHSMITCGYMIHYDYTMMYLA